MPLSLVQRERMAEGLSVEEQINFFSHLFSGYQTTIEKIRKMSPEEQMSDEINSDENCPIEKLLSTVEQNYGHDTPVPVLEYLFNSIIGIEAYHSLDTDRVKENKEHDYLLLDNDSFSEWIFDAGKEVIHLWNHKADDVRQRILDIGAKRRGELSWFYFQSFLAEAFEEEDESAYDI